MIKPQFANVWTPTDIISHDFRIWQQKKGDTQQLRCGRRLSRVSDSHVRDLREFVSCTVCRGSVCRCWWSRVCCEKTTTVSICSIWMIYLWYDMFILMFCFQMRCVDASSFRTWYHPNLFFKHLRDLNMKRIIHIFQIAFQGPILWYTPLKIYMSPKKGPFLGGKNYLPSIIILRGYVSFPFLNFYVSS